MITKINYTKPSITQLEIDYANDAVTNGWGDNCYQYIKRFENLFKNYLNINHVISTSSCTGALHMGLTGLGIKKGDEIIIADTNWIAVAAPIVHLGAKPVFVDILEDTWCIDPDKVEKSINNKTKAIIAVHLYGNLCDMSKLQNISEKYNIPIIEDAAEAIGSIYKGKRAGSMSKFGTFSLHGSKTITAGESSEGSYINAFSFIRDRYFFIDDLFKLQYYPLSEENIHSYLPNYVVVKHEIWKKISDNSNEAADVVNGSAYVDPRVYNQNTDFENATWVRLKEDHHDGEGGDYEINRYSGYIRFNNIQSQDIIAISYKIGKYDMENLDDPWIDNSENYTNPETGETYNEWANVVGYFEPYLIENGFDTANFESELQPYLEYHGTELKEEECVNQGIDCSIKINL